MDENKVIEYLKTKSEILADDIESETSLGNIIIDLLYKAENGDFFYGKKPEMVRICDTKYTHFANNYDNCAIEEIIGCNLCQYYVPKYVLDLFEKFEKEGFPTDEELGISSSF